MSKISKFIICCMAVILSIVSLCVPTYCSSISSTLFDIKLVESFPNENNYYNLNNIKYVNYKNLVVNRNLGLVLYANNITDLPISYYDGQIFNETYTHNFPNGVSYIVDSSYHLAIRNDAFFVYCDSWNLNWQSIPIFNMGQSEYSYTFGLRWIPSQIINDINGKFDNLHIYGGFNFSYEIVYDGQYFYNDIFSFTNDMSFITTGLAEIPILYGENVNKDFILTDNYSDSYYKQIPFSSNDFNNNFLYLKNLLYSDRYITKVQSTFYFGYIAFGDFDNLNRLHFQYIFKYVDYDSNNSINIYSGSSTGSDGAVGSLIPNGSNNLYKTAEWWDIPSHLYNFFIYLIFDAPIISNFTNLVIVIINFIVELFDFIIGLFTGINNIFFISIFVGIIVLIFLLKIIFKG